MVKTEHKAQHFSYSLPKKKMKPAPKHISWMTSYAWQNVDVLICVGTVRDAECCEWVCSHRCLQPLHVFVTGRRENAIAHQRVFKSVGAGTFLRQPQKPGCFVCASLTLPGHLQFPAFLRPLQLSGIPTVDRELPRARGALSSDSCNELLKTYACISGISLEVLTQSDRWLALEVAQSAFVLSTFS